MTDKLEDLTQTTSGLHRVFVYGTLMNDGQFQDSAIGELRVLDDGYAVVDFSRPDTVYGAIIYVPQDELIQLDQREECRAPHYKRVVIVTNSGFVAYAYEFDAMGFHNKSFDDLKLIESGRWDPSYLT